MPPRQPPRKAKGAVGETNTAKAAVFKTKETSKAEPKAKGRVAKRKVVETSPEPDLTSEEEEGEEEEDEEEEARKPVKKRKTIPKTQLKEDDSADEKPKAAAPKKQRTAKAKAKPEGAMPLAERTAIASLKKAMYIGAHVSSAGGVQSSIANTVHIGANAFALFLKSQRKWANPPMTPEARDGFRSLSRTHKFDVHRHCLPHGSYLVNLAQAEKEKAAQAYGAFLDDLQRCESLGITLYNFHPGNTNGDVREAAIGRIAAQLNKAHKATSTVVTVLENMAGQGNVIGSTFEDLRDIIALVDDKTRVGVCIDTCHAFAAGYDLRSPEAFAATMSKFNETVGASYLRALHINDSKAPFGSNRDLHANIGTGYLGLRAFHNVVNYDALAGLPMVLETPIDRPGPNGKAVEDKQIWADEIKLLESLIGMDVSSAEFTALEEKLQAQGAGERAKIQDQVDRKNAKATKKTAAKPRGNKKKVDQDSDGDSE
ncbi:putative apurinic apyrimidinic endonuclease-like protein [Rosellinia necatrix]|uniref:Apurinic-apyrimidinic endonuclease 1 n=1 Tax=Rosellinia necatrix TaxID=77044 RepID=A0A1W2TDI2_ROSNE|nr:putative apurinic apyrimidinic endonuclease-like protein [Rosellinia necatrix]